MCASSFANANFCGGESLGISSGWPDPIYHQVHIIGDARPYQLPGKSQTPLWMMRQSSCLHGVVCDTHWLIVGTPLRRPAEIALGASTASVGKLLVGCELFLADAQNVVDNGK